MKVSVLVVPRAKRERVETQADGSLRVWVAAIPADNEANERLRELLCQHFDVPKTAVTIERGLSSRRKVVKIL